MNKGIKYKSFIILVLAFTCFSNWSIAQVIYSDATQNLQIGKEIYLLTDESNNLSIDEIIKSDKFFKNQKDVANLGITKSTIWARISVKNNSLENNLIFQLNQPILDKVTFYYFDSKYCQTSMHELQNRRRKLQR
jgi:hypothetical protein